MKKSFITGLIILLPLALTTIIILFLFNLLTDPFAGILNSFIEKTSIFENGFLFFTREQIQYIVSKLLILTSLFFFTVLLGIIARWFFISYLLKYTDALFHKIPFISTVYKTCKDVIDTIFTTSSNAFKQVVLVPFPNPDTYSIGLITKENVPGLSDQKESQMISVFVPTTPNPTSGFLMIYKAKDLIYLDMKVEDALKYTISCGVIPTQFNHMKKEL